MAILDQYGRPVSIQRKFSRASERGSGRPYTPVSLGDIDDLINAYDHKTLLSASRRLFSNMGLPRGAIIQKANYSVGRAWDAKFLGSNRSWGQQAEEWLRYQFYPVSDVRGNMYDFKTNLHIDSISIDRDGDYGVMLTESKNGFPQFQRFGAHRIGQRDNQKKTVESGPYKGAKIKNGVISNKIGRPVAYRILGDDDSKDQDVSARDFIHVFNPYWYEQGRGLPAGIHAIDKLLTSERSEEWEEMAMLMVSSLGLIEYNETGLADDDNASVITGSVQSDGTEGISTQSFAGGSVRHFKANSGARLESIKHDRPGDLWEKFQDRMARHYIAGFDWSYAFAWKPESLTGVSQRVELEKVGKAIQDRQALLNGPAKRMISYAIAKAIKLGQLPKNDEWYKWGFNLPPKLSIDAGRDSKRNIEEYKIGAKNMTAWCSELGLSYEEHLRERMLEIALKKKIKKEIEAQTGEFIEDREVQMLTPNEQAGVQASEVEVEGQVRQTEKLKFDSLKAKFDAYGVAVRAGALTPQTSDEDQFRSEAGLPIMSEAVDSAWNDDGGVRRPITLQSKTERDAEIQTGEEA
jgi:hypothetical protein